MTSLILKKVLIIFGVILICFFLIILIRRQTDGIISAHNVLPKSSGNIVLGMSFQEFSNRATFKYEINKPFKDRYFYDNKSFIVFEAKGDNEFVSAYFCFEKEPNILTYMEMVVQEDSTIENFNKMVDDFVKKFKRPRKYVDDGIWIAEWKDPETEMTIMFNPVTKELSISYGLRAFPLWCRE